MKENIQMLNGQVTVRLTGTVSVKEATALREALLEYVEKGHSRFIINMESLDFIDSAGLGVLVAIHKRARQQGGELILQGIKGMVKEVFELTRLTKVFNIQ
ncbi:STAS domain-containing protein [Heliorestis convoluta]|uniref:Anti-sigma factor antagonist n=1 Tax=Heliorestis convoluta TaxID=356322 RepID=A0A5Q2N548_9FIRM|nr:STAS domain-containing protein [Heliorestis convoluta]QGG48746.1 Anti-sigma-B factor antagonist [Heliorestis convoluta]